MAVFPGSAIPSAADDYTIDQSLRFNVGDSPYLSRTIGSPMDGKAWTFSCWYKRGKLGGDYHYTLGGDNPSGTQNGQVGFSGSSGTLENGIFFTITKIWHFYGNFSKRSSYMRCLDCYFFFLLFT